MHPQSGVFAFGTSEHWYAEFDLLPGASPTELAAALAALDGDSTPLVASNVVIGFRPELWASIAPGDAPSGVRSFEAVEGPNYSMPATQHDAWVWCAGDARDAVFDNGAAVLRSLEGLASLATEASGWVYRRHRDLTGFIDGTENPPVAEAPGVALVEDGPGSGSSVLLVQQWEHYASWASLNEKDQEAVIGRTKPDSVQLADDVMPADSHVSRNVVEEDGEELAIFRRNTSWGDPGKHGTMFVGFCGSQHPLQVMLERMAGVPDGIRDALTRYTVPLTGAYYVVPSLDALARFLADD
jgi:porphyrinogen peroxidase